jgi:hypothetical protein
MGARRKANKNDVLAELLDLLNLARDLLGEGLLKGLHNKAIVSELFTRTIWIRGH